MIKIFFINPLGKVLLESFAPVLPDKAETIKISGKLYVVEARCFDASEAGMIAHITLLTDN